MLTLSIQDAAIARAIQLKTLDFYQRQVSEHLRAIVGDEPHWVIADDKGIIELCDTLEEVNAKIARVENALAA